MRARVISLRFELGVLGDAVLAARMLIHAHRHRQAGDEHDQRKAIGAAAAVLELVGARVRLVDRTLSRSVEVELLAEHFNEANATAAQLKVLAGEDALLPVPARERRGTR